MSTPVAQVVGALTLPFLDGVEAEPVLGADPPEVRAQALDGPQEHEEGRLLQPAGEVGPPHCSVLDQQAQLVDGANHATTSSRISLPDSLPFRTAPFRQGARAFPY